MSLRAAKKPQFALKKSEENGAVNQPFDANSDEQRLAKWIDTFVSSIRNEVKDSEFSIREWRKKIQQTQVSMGRNVLLLSLSTTALIEHLAGMIAKVRSVPGVKEVTLGDAVMTFTTEPLWVQNTLVNPITNHFLGAYKVCVYHNGKIEFCSITNLWRGCKEDTIHPHMLAGDVCLGGYQNMIGAAYSAFDYYNLTLIIMEYLRNVTLTDSRGSHLIGKFPQHEKPPMTEQEIHKSPYYEMFRDLDKIKLTTRSRSFGPNRRNRDDDDDDEEE